MIHLLPYYRKLTNYWIVVLLTLFLSLLYSFIAFSNPFINKIIFDNLIVSFEKNLLFFIISALVFTALLYIFTSFFIDCMIAYLRLQVITAIRMDVTSRIFTYNYSYFCNNKHGDNIQRLIPEIDTVGQVIAMSVKSCGYILQIFFTLGLITLMNYKLSIFFLVLILIYLLYSAVFNKIICIYSGKVQGKIGSVYDYFLDYLRNIKLIKIFDASGIKRSQLQSQLFSLKKSSLKLSFFKSISIQSSKLLDIAVLFVIFFSFNQIKHNQMSIGDYVVYSSMIFVLMHPVLFITEMGNLLQSGSVAAQRINDLYNGVEEKSGIFNFMNLQDCIEFRNVNFSYIDSVQILNNVNFKIQKGTKTYIIGKSGSGKSSLVNILTRLYDVQDGIILIDNIPLKNYKISSLRQRISVLSQDVFIFNDSIAFNIDPHKQLKYSDIRELLKKFQLHKHQDKINFCTGEKGARLSGGEKQKLAFARMIARNCEIFILDEATSNIDPFTTNLITETLDTIKKENPNITIILITHSMECIADQDSVIVLDNGRVVESGIKRDLLSSENRITRVLLNSGK